MKIYNKDSTDKTDIMNVRQGVVQRFEATNWLDLRIGFLVSITGPVLDDDTAALTETITGPFLGFYDRYYIGVVDNTGSTYIVYTNRANAGIPETRGDSKLLSSDGGLGTDNAFFWRPHNGDNANWSFQILDNANLRPNTRRQSGDGAQIHLAQDSAGAGGYATLLMMRLRRDNVTTRAKVISCQIKSDPIAHNGDVLYTDTPTDPFLTANLEAFPTNVQAFEPVELTTVPNCLVWYWPFHNSRLRIHAYGILKVIV